jgi:hypothetical protein
LEDAAGHAGASLEWYDEAGAAMPLAQAARLAASDLRHRAGARQDAASRAGQGQTGRRDGAPGVRTPVIDGSEGPP